MELSGIALAASTGDDTVESNDDGKIRWFPLQHGAALAAGPVRQPDGDSPGHGPADRTTGPEETHPEPGGSAGRLQCGEFTCKMEGFYIFHQLFSIDTFSSWLL